MREATKKALVEKTQKLGLTAVGYLVRAVVFVLWGRGKYRTFKWLRLDLTSVTRGVSSNLLSPTPESDQIVKETLAAINKHEPGEVAFGVMAQGKSGAALDRLARKAGLRIE